VVSIIRAFSAIAHSIPHHLLIAGSPGWLMSPVASAIAESPNRARIHSIGVVPEEDKPALYAHADVFVYPSFYEGFGFPPLEALSLGTPVITSYNSSLPEIVGKWSALTDPYDPAELAGVLMQTLRSADRVPLIVRREIEAQYSWDRVAKDTLAVLEKVV